MNGRALISMPLRDADQLLSTAVLILAAGTGSIQDRVFNAYLSSAMHINPGKDLPGDLRPRFEKIHAAMTAADPAGDEGRIFASARRLSDEEARAIAEAVVEIHSAVVRELLDAARAQTPPTNVRESPADEGEAAGLHDLIMEATVAIDPVSQAIVERLANLLPSSHESPGDYVRAVIADEEATCLSLDLFGRVHGAPTTPLQWPAFTCKFAGHGIVDPESP